MKHFKIKDDNEVSISVLSTGRNKRYFIEINNVADIVYYKRKYNSWNCNPNKVKDNNLYIGLNNSPFRNFYISDCTIEELRSELDELEIYNNLYNNRVKKIIIL